MDVMKYIKEKRKISPLHFCLIDPDKQPPAQAGELARKAEEIGSDAIMVGGSQPAQLIYLDECIKAIKANVKIPVILFPSSHSGLSKYADALFFMSLLNSRSTQYLIDEQMKGAVLVQNYGLDTLPMAYLIIESGSQTSASWAADVKPIPRDKPSFTVAYSLAAKYLGMKFIYLEAGSGAKYPVPVDMVKMTKEAIGSNFLIVGGGIKNKDAALERVAAGADIIVTGTVNEQDPQAFKEIVQAVKGKS